MYIHESQISLQFHRHSHFPMLCKSIALVIIANMHDKSSKGKTALQIPGFFLRKLVYAIYTSTLLLQCIFPVIGIFRVGTDSVRAMIRALLAPLLALLEAVSYGKPPTPLIYFRPCSVEVKYTLYQHTKNGDFLIWLLFILLCA